MRLSSRCSSVPITQSRASSRQSRATGTGTSGQVARYPCQRDSGPKATSYATWTARRSAGVCEARGSPLRRDARAEERCERTSETGMRPTEHGEAETCVSGSQAASVAGWTCRLSEAGWERERRQRWSRLRARRARGAGQGRHGAARASRPAACARRKEGGAKARAEAELRVAGPCALAWARSGLLRCAVPASWLRGLRELQLHPQRPRPLLCSRSRSACKHKHASRAVSTPCSPLLVAVVHSPPRSQLVARPTRRRIARNSHATPTRAVRICCSGAAASHPQIRSSRAHLQLSRVASIASTTSRSSSAAAARAPSCLLCVLQPTADELSHASHAITLASSRRTTCRRLSTAIHLPSCTSSRRSPARRPALCPLLSPRYTAPPRRSLC